MLVKMATVAKRLMSAAEFEREYMGTRAELWRGEVHEYMPASRRHGRVASNINTAINYHSKQHRLGEVHAAETGFVVRTPAGESVLAPDVAFIRKERIPPDLPDEGFCPIVPDLVVEVLSPSETLAAAHEKAREWLAGGATLVWLIDPKRRIVEVWRREGLTQTLQRRRYPVGRGGAAWLCVPRARVVGVGAGLHLFVLFGNSLQLRNHFVVAGASCGALEFNQLA
jgi:Uma2 family endonuclease